MTKISIMEIFVVVNLLKKKLII